MPVALPTMLNFAQPNVDHDGLYKWGPQSMRDSIKKNHDREGAAMSPGYHVCTIM
jgi:hypothetical protein